MEKIGMEMTEHGLSEKEEESAQLLMAECKNTRDIQETLKRLFAGTIEQMLDAEMDEMWSFYHDKSHQIWLWRAIDHATNTPLAFTF